MLYLIIESDKGNRNVGEYPILRKVVREMKIKEFMTKLMVRFSNRKGQGMVEYGLIVGIIAVIIIGVFVLLDEPLKNLFETIGDIITDNTPTPPAS